MTSVLVSHSAYAHLHDPTVPPCFEWRNEKVEPRQDESGQNYVVFGAPRLSPPNKSNFAPDEQLTIELDVNGQLCSPFYVYLLPQTRSSSPALIQKTTPSPIYSRGAFNRQVRHTVTFSVNPIQPQAGATSALSALRIVVTQYGSDKELFRHTIPFVASWRAPSDLTVAGIPEYECAQDMQLPAKIEPVVRCSNSLTAPVDSERLDLDQDGICERIVRDSVCDKTHGNRCFRILAERDGSWQPIAQFYNELTQHSSNTGHYSLSSLELGPLSNVTRFSEWRANAYVTHMYLHNCDRLP